MMMRQVTVIITADGQIKLSGDDLPDLRPLEDMLGTQEIDDDLRQLGLDTEINSHLCG